MNQGVPHPSNFYVWLTKQVDKQSPIGQLAKKAKDDVFFPTAGSTIDPFKEYLIQKSFDGPVMQALEEAWKEYSELKVSEITGLTKY